MLLLVLAASTASCLGQSTATTSVISQPAIKDFQPLGKPPDLNPVEPIKEFEPLGKTPALKPVEPLVDWLPIWGKPAREKGYDLPLPFGVCLSYTYINQNMVVSDVQIQGNPLNVAIPNAPTISHTGVLRADGWLFPFLNVYGLFGYTSGTTKPGVVFPDGQVVEATLHYHRPSYGGGLTLAGGWKAYFLTLDANFTIGDAYSAEGGRIGEDPLTSFTITPRAGVIFSSGRLGTGALWIGGMNLNAEAVIHGPIDLSGNPGLAVLVGGNTLEYSVKIRPQDKWNLLIGGNWQMNRRWSITAEVGGILDRFQVISSVMLRF
jgi:hypothetical protein